MQGLEKYYAGLKKARSLGRWKKNYTFPYFHFVEEDLYQLETGELFLLAYGGPLVKHEVPYTGGKLNGFQLVPLDKQKALDWSRTRSDQIDYDRSYLQ